jgi:hypothetical protein
MAPPRITSTYSHAVFEETGLSSSDEEEGRQQGSIRRSMVPGPMSNRRTEMPGRSASAVQFSTPSPSLSNWPSLIPTPTAPRPQYPPPLTREEIRQAREKRMDWFLDTELLSRYCQLVEEFSEDEIIESLHRRTDEALLDISSYHNPVSILITALETLKDKPKADEIMRLLPGFLIKCSERFQPLNNQLKFLSNLIFEIYRLGNDAVGKHREHDLQFQFCSGIPKNIYQFFLKLPPVEDKQTDAGSDTMQLTAKVAYYLCETVGKQLKHRKFKQKSLEQQDYIKVIYRETRLCRFATCGLDLSDHYSIVPPPGSKRFLDWIKADKNNVAARAEMTRRICDYWYTKPPVLDLSGCGVNQLPDDISWAQILRLKEGYDNHSCLPTEDEKIRSLFTTKRHLIERLYLHNNPLKSWPWCFFDVRPTCRIAWDENPSGTRRLDPRFL